MKKILTTTFLDLLPMKVSGCLALWCNIENTSSHKGSFPLAFSFYQPIKILENVNIKFWKPTNKKIPYHGSSIWCKWHCTSRISA